MRDKAPVTTGHGSLIVQIIAYDFGNDSLKLQGLIRIVALQASSGLYSDCIDTVPYILHTFDRVLRKVACKIGAATEYFVFKKICEHRPRQPYVAWTPSPQYNEASGIARATSLMLSDYH
jgi:hypothetical protein